MLNMLTRIFQPKEIVIKKGSLIRLKFLIGKNVVILIGGKSLEKNGHLQKIEKYFATSKVNYTIIRGITGEPTEKSVSNIVKKIIEIKPDWMIGVGGGSVIDTTKLALAFYENPTMSFNDFEVSYTVPENREKAKLCLIPTTSGTGSEASNSAIVLIGKNKIPIISNSFIPDIAILDPNLTLGQSKEITCSTGIDAFSHAMESYCSTLSNSFTKAYSIMGAKLIINNLKNVLLNPDDLIFREKLLYGSMISGLAQSIVSVGGVHAMSHSLASSINLSHGHLNALFLTSIMKYNSVESDNIKDFLNGIEIKSIDELDEWIQEMMELSHLKNKWGDFSKDFNFDNMSEKIINDVCARTNPRKLTVEIIKLILEETRR